MLSFVTLSAQLRASKLSLNFMCLSRATHATTSRPSDAYLTKYYQAPSVLCRFKPSLLHQCIRSFHVSSLKASSCDFGSPCDYSDCRQTARKPICEVCGISPTAHQHAEYTKNRKKPVATTFCLSAQIVGTNVWGPGRGPPIGELRNKYSARTNSI